MVNDKKNHLIILSNPNDLVKMGNYCKKLFSFNSNLFVLVKSVKENSIHSIFDCLHKFSENGGSVQVKLVSNVVEYKYINFLIEELQISHVVFFESRVFWFKKMVEQRSLYKLIESIKVPLLYIGHKHQLKEVSILLPYDHPMKIASLLMDNGIQLTSGQIQIFIPNTQAEKQFGEFMNIKGMVEGINQANVHLFTIGSEEDTHSYIMQGIRQNKHCVVCINKRKNYFKQLFKNMRGFLASSRIPQTAFLYYQ